MLEGVRREEKGLMWAVEGLGGGGAGKGSLERHLTLIPIRFSQDNFGSIGLQYSVFHKKFVFYNVLKHMYSRRLLAGQSARRDSKKKSGNPVFPSNI